MRPRAAAPSASPARPHACVRVCVGHRPAPPCGGLLLTRPRSLATSFARSVGVLFLYGGCACVLCVRTFDRFPPARARISLHSRAVLALVERTSALLRVRAHARVVVRRGLGCRYPDVLRPVVSQFELSAPIARRETDPREEAWHRARLFLAHDERAAGGGGADEDDAVAERGRQLDSLLCYLFDAACRGACHGDPPPSPPQRPRLTIHAPCTPFRPTPQPRHSRTIRRHGSMGGPLGIRARCFLRAPCEFALTRLRPAAQRCLLS